MKELPTNYQTNKQEKVMKTNRICTAAGKIAIVIVMIGIIQCFSAQYPTAEATIRESLSDVQQRYRSRLDYHGWTELYYGETRGICDLELNMPEVTAPLSILYFRSSDTIQYPQIMPKGLAQQLIADRMLIDMYQKSLNASKTDVHDNTQQLSQESKAEQAAGLDKFLNENKHLGMALAVVRYSRESGLSKDTIQNLLGYRKRPEEMSVERRTEWMKGSEYRHQKEKTEKEKIVRSLKRSQIYDYLGESEGEDFIALHQRVMKGETLTEKEQIAHDESYEKVARMAGRGKQTAYQPLHSGNYRLSEKFRRHANELVKRQKEPLRIPTERNRRKINLTGEKGFGFGDR